MLNRGYTYRSAVQANDQPVLDWLVANFPHSNADTWRQRLAAGELALGDAPLTETSRLQRGQIVRWARPPWEEPDVPRDFHIIHEDADLLVVNKPSGLPTMPAGGFLENTLLSLIRRTHPTASPAHRLGRGTSGLVVFALTPEARSSLTRDLREHRVQKHYAAIVDGNPTWDALSIEAPIGPVDHPRLRSIFAASPTGKPARTDVSVVTRHLRSTSGDVTHVRAQIHTGRPHQIRIHLASVGHPLTGDPLYGPGGLPKADALPGDLGYFLHAERLVLQHPTTKEQCTFWCEVPF